MHKAILLLREIPRGKVTTYGELARATRSSPRAVGQMMRRNAHPELYPCYKVVASNGKLGGYAGCTKGEQIGKKISLLKKDGIAVEKGRIDLSRYLHRFQESK